jgi:hypothetical protein
LYFAFSSWAEICLLVCICSTWCDFFSIYSFIAVLFRNHHPTDPGRAVLGPFGVRGEGFQSFLSFFWRRIVIVAPAVHPRRAQGVLYWNAQVSNFTGSSRGRKMWSIIMIWSRTSSFFPLCGLIEDFSLMKSNYDV